MGRWSCNYDYTADWSRMLMVNGIGRYAMIRFVCSFIRPALQYSINDLLFQQAQRELDAQGETENCPNAVPASASSPANGAVSEIDYAAINSKFRRVAAKGISQETFQGDLQLLLKLLAILTELFGSHFELTSEDFEVQQLATVARQLLDGDIPSRKYQSTVVAKGTIEARAFESLDLRWKNESLWSTVPETCHTVAWRAQAFRSLSTLGCAVKELMLVPEQNPAKQVCRALDEPIIARRIAKMPLRKAARNS